MADKYTNRSSENGSFLDKKTYVKQAENVIADLQKFEGGQLKVTSTQLRNIHTMMTELYNMITHYSEETLNDDIQSHVQYIKMKIAYNAGRNFDVKRFVERSHLMKYLDDVGDSKSRLLLVFHYSESLVAYHKFYGGKD